MSVAPKIGTQVLCKRKEEKAYEKRFIIDYLPTTKMISFGISKYSDPIYYHDISNWDIKEIE